MAFNIDIGFATRAGRKDVNEDFCAAMLPEPGQEAVGSIVAIADGASAGGMGKEAALANPHRAQSRGARQTPAL